MSVRTYNPSVRVGNWNEDICLEDDLLKDFLDKKEKGELYIQRTHNLLQTILKKQDLSPIHEDGHLHIGDKINLYNISTSSVVSAFMTAAEAHEATQLIPGCQVSGSTQYHSCPRNIFVITSTDPTRQPDGTVVRYGDHVVLSTLPEEGGELKLHSDSFSFMKHSKHSREQEVTLVQETSYCCHWKFICFNPQDRLETEGEPVPVNTKVLINHCKTNQNLSLNTEYRLRTPFGLEYEITACTKYNQHKVEDTNNQFMIAVGNNEDTQILDTSNN